MRTRLPPKVAVIGNYAGQRLQYGHQRLQRLPQQLTQAIGRGPQPIAHQSRLESRCGAVQRQNVRAHPVRFAARLAYSGPGPPLPRRSPLLAPACHQLLAPRIVDLDQLVDEQLRLVHRQSPSDDNLASGTLVATWQRGERHRRTRGHQSQTDPRLNLRLELLCQDPPTTDPGLVPSQPLRHPSLGQPVVAHQGPNQPRLLQLREAAAPVQRRDHQDCLDRSDLVVPGP